MHLRPSGFAGDHLDRRLEIFDPARDVGIAGAVARSGRSPRGPWSRRRSRSARTRSSSSIRLARERQVEALREEFDEPCTKNSTGRGASPGVGAPTRLRYMLERDVALLRPVFGAPDGAARAGGGRARRRGRLRRAVPNTLDARPAPSPSPATLMTSRLPIAEISCRPPDLACGASLMQRLRPAPRAARHVLATALRPRHIGDREPGDALVVLRQRAQFVLGDDSRRDSSNGWSPTSSSTLMLMKSGGCSRLVRTILAATGARAAS